VLYEGKDFGKKSYYNQCLGVLSPPLDTIMTRDLGIAFPRHLIQKEIAGYYIHCERNILKLAGEHEPSFACRRVEFDNYLFQTVKERGIEVVPARVTDLDFYPDGVMVYSESNNIKADVVVGAFGLDDGMAKIFERLTPYRMPQFLSSVVTKFHPGEKAMDDFGRYLHAFLPSSLRSVEFGAITPKGNHLSLNIAGKKVDSLLMDQFLRLPGVSETLPPNLEDFLPCAHYYKGKFPTIPAVAPVGERYVMIGDAAGLNRPFKGKGINSAILTGIRAAEAIVNKGFSQDALSEYLKSCRELTDDIPYGRILRFITNLVSRLGLLDGVLETAKSEPALRKAFFNIVSGQETYKKTWQNVRKPAFLARIIFKSLIHAVKGLKTKRKE
jgi:flavin-dependent dehydrogenase